MRIAQEFRLLRTPRELRAAMLRNCEEATELMDQRTHEARLKALALLEDALRLDRCASRMLSHGWTLDGRVA